MSLAEHITMVFGRYPHGWIEVGVSVSIQLVYLAFGLVIEQMRPPYRSKTTPTMLVQSMRNHIVATSLHAFYVYWAAGQSVLRRTYLPPYAFPSWLELISDVVIALVLRDMLCWAIHRFWHLPAVYPYVHAKHHTILEPGDHHVLTISYMSVVDFVFLYGAPVLALVKLLEMNILTTAIFAFVSASAEQVKLIYGDEAHDSHHEDGSGNYGTLGIADVLMGTASSTKAQQDEQKACGLEP